MLVVEFEFHHLLLCENRGEDHNAIRDFAVRLRLLLPNFTSEAATSAESFVLRPLNPADGEAEVLCETLHSPRIVGSDARAAPNKLVNQSMVCRVAWNRFEKRMIASANFAVRLRSNTWRLSLDHRMHRSSKFNAAFRRSSEPPSRARGAWSWNFWSWLLEFEVHFSSSVTRIGRSNLTLGAPLPLVATVVSGPIPVGRQNAWMPRVPFCFGNGVDDFAAAVGAIAPGE